MEETTSPTKPPVGAILAIVGGVLVIVGSFTTWASAKAQGVQLDSATGTSGNAGKTSLVLGAVVLVAGIMLFVRRRRGMAVLAIVFGALALLLGVLKITDIKANLLDQIADTVAKQQGVPASVIRGQIKAAGVTVSIGFGLYLVAAGGAIGLVGGALGLGGSSSAPSSAIPAAPGFPTGMPAAPGAPIPPAPPVPPAPGDLGAPPPPPMPDSGPPAQPPAP